MRILLEELKKIITWKIITLLILVSFIIYQLFIVFELEHFPNGRPALDIFLATQEMLEAYGEEMDQKEFAHFKDVYEEKIEEATRYLQSKEEVVSAGMDTYEKFRKADLADEQIASLHSKIIFEENVDVFWEIQAREALIETYENPERYGQGYSEGPLNAKQSERINELVAGGATTAIFTYLVFDNYNMMIPYVAILIFLSIMIVVLPLYLGDRRNHVEFLQYTSKVGRGLFTRKLTTALVAAFFVITVHLGCFFILYAGNGTGMFLPLNVHSIINYAFFSWYDLTFFQYILLTVFSIYIIGLSLVFLVACISSIAPNYMTSIGIHVPLAFILFGFGVRYLVKNVTNIFLPQYFLQIALLCVISLSVGLIFIKYKQEGSRDIV